MNSWTVSLCLMATIVASGCNGELQLSEGEKVFGFLKVGDKCTKETNEEAKKMCLTQRWTKFCDKVNSPPCECLDDNVLTSPEEKKTCINGKVQTYCSANKESVKCQMFESCKGLDGEFEESDECVKEFCEDPDNADKFECLAFACKKNNSKPPQKINCIKEACKTNGEARICQAISDCQAANPSLLLGKLKVFKCLITTIFGGLENLQM